MKVEQFLILSIPLRQFKMRSLLDSMSDTDDGRIEDKI